MVASGMTANQASFWGAVLSILYALALYYGSVKFSWLLLLVPFLGLFRLVMNALDGMLARRHHTACVQGELANELLDIVGDTICYGALLWVPGISTLPVVVLLISSWFAEFVGVMGKGFPGGQRRQESVFGGKTERMIWVGLFALGLYFYPSFLSLAGKYFSCVSVWVILTGVARMKAIAKASKGLFYQSYTPYGE